VSPLLGGRRPGVPVAAGEKVLAWARTAEGLVAAGTRDAFYVHSDVEPGETVRVPWEQVEAADWDADASVLRVSEVGTWGEARPEHVLNIDDPGRLLQLVRERVTATVVVQRHIPVHGRRGLRVIARRAPGGERRVTWIFEYDAGIDPDDPDVRATAQAALAQVREEVGL
jgi:hypothetical protein